MYICVSTFHHFVGRIATKTNKYNRGRVFGKRLTAVIHSHHSSSQALPLNMINHLVILWSGGYLLSRHGGFVSSNRASMFVCLVPHSMDFH